MRIPLTLGYGKSNFSHAGPAFFVAAAVEGRLGRTHFTNPDPEMCYRFPVSDETLNPGGLTKNATRHFLRMRNTPNRGHIIT